MPFTEIPGCLHDDPTISDDDKSRIVVLPEAESQKLWDELVSASNRHFMLLDPSEWPARLVNDNPLFYRWHDDWNANKPDHRTDKLNELDVSGTDELRVFWMREIGARTNWDTFTRNWMNFLYEDEGSIILPASGTMALVFSNGHVWAGNRQPTET